MLIFLVVVTKIKKYKKPKRKFKFISIQKILRYIKLVLDFKSLIIIVIFSSISNLIVINLENKYENLYSGLEEINVIAKIVDNGKNKEYKNTYKIKVESVNGSNKYKATYLYLKVNKNVDAILKYGDYIKVNGIYEEPGKATNYQGFDYSEYLKTLKVYGTIEAENIKILKENSNNILFTISNNIFIKIKDIVQENLPKEKANLLLGILVGYKDEISETIKENFEQSNISHVLAVSGLHVSYIILAITNILEKIQGKRKAKIVTIFFIIAYMFITNFSPSVVRAGLMGILSMLAMLTYNKNDIWTSIAISLLCILIYNPYLIISAGVLLSYGGTIGIIVFQRSASSIFQKLKSKSEKYITKSYIRNVIDYIQDTMAVSFSAQIVIAPIMARLFNTTSLSFFITNFFVSIIIGPIIIIGFLFIISNYLFLQIFSLLIIKTVIKFILEKLLEILIFISNLGNILPFSKVYIATPKIWGIVIYYIFMIILNVFYRISLKRKITVFQKRIINWKNLLKHLLRKNKKTVISAVLALGVIIFIVNLIPKDLKIYFIDVGQGDSTLIVTPKNKTILIDGGGSENYNVGENILVPYLLDRKITRIDYVIISHFDTDHVGRSTNSNGRIKSEKCNYWEAI